MTAPPSHLGDVLRAAGHQHADVEALVQPVEGSPSVRLTFGEWDAAADAVARALADRGVGHGDVVCLLLPPSIDYAVCYLAAARLGAVTSGINLRLGEQERRSIVDRLGPVLTVVERGTAGGAGMVVDRQEVAAMVGEARSDAAAGRRVPGPPAVRVDPDDPVAVVWTSGSTGTPKGAVFRHRALQAVAAGSDVLLQPGDRRLSPLPFAHVGSMTRAWDEITRRITTVITPQPWSAAGAIACMAEERVTVGQGVPTQWALVLAHPALAAADLSHLRVAGTGGSSVPPELVRAMRQRLRCPVVVRYTSTETSLGTGTVPGDPDDVVATTVGRPVPGVELQLADEEGRGVEPGNVGRVRLRSGAAMAGYAGRGAAVDPVATAEVLDAQGWVTTGDLGWMGADGNLRLVGRAGDMYIRGGYNVYPVEVEAVLGALAGVEQAAVVGTEDPVLGEIGVAFVVASRPVPTLGDLRRACAGRMADYKAPDRLVLVDDLPLTAMGKVDKQTLRERLAHCAPAGRECHDSTR